MLRPGTDAALAVAIMHVLFAEGFANREFMARYADVPAELERHVANRSPEWAEKITGIPAETIRDVARLYGRTLRSFIRVGYGFSRSRNGAVSLHAVSCLPTVTGAWEHKGGGALYSNRTIYHINNRLIMGLDLKDNSIRELDQSRLGAVLTGDKRDLGDGPPVTAMIIQNTNPMNVCPNTKLVRDGFARDDLFTAVHEQFMTETAAMADIVLPATTFLEHDDFYRASGHTHLQVTRKVVEPFAEAKPNHYVISELAKRLGCTHPGFSMSEWEIMDETLKLSGHPDAQTLYDAHWQDCAEDFGAMHFTNGFGHADGKFRFKPDWAAIGPNIEGLPSLPDYAPLVDAANAEHPLRLVTAPARQFLNSTFTMTPSSRRREGRPTLLIHPQDGKRYKIQDGAAIDVGNKLGVIELHAKYFDGLLPGVVVIESLWANADFPGGLGVNTLVSDDAGKPDGGAVFHDTAVWIRPAASRAAA
jgi:anaerobic selenocysteine-containing dehydrogenase